MKKYIFALLLFVNILPIFSQQHTFRLATYNIRYDNPKDLGNLWSDRKLIITDLIQKHQFDIFCAQEAKANQIKDLTSAMPEYNWTGIDKEGNGNDEYCAIFYRKDRFRLIDEGHFWLSETPDAASKGWDAKYKRVCSWAYLEDRQGGETFYVFDTHFDHKGMLAQENSAKLIIQKIKDKAGNNAAILCGDFNFDRTSPYYPLLHKSGILKDAFVVSKVRKTSSGSFNGFKINANPESPIDHIFVTPSSVEIKKYSIIRDSYNGKLPSDHYPVLVEVGFTNRKKAKK